MIASATGVLFASQASADTIAYQNPSGDYGNQPGGPWVVGLQFTVGSSPLSVTELGAFDNGQGAWISPITVQIYDFTTEATVGSSVTLSGSGASEGTLGSDGGSRFLPVTPFTLSANTSYMVVAAGYSGTAGYEQNYNAGVPPSIVLSQAPEITVDNNYYAAGLSMTFPTILDGGPDPRYAAGTFEFEVVAVPEPSTLALATVGGLGVLLLFRRRK